MTMSWTDPVGVGGLDVFLLGSMGNMTSDADPTTHRCLIARDYTKCGAIARAFRRTQGVTVFCMFGPLSLEAKTSSAGVAACRRTYVNMAEQASAFKLDIADA